MAATIWKGHLTFGLVSIPIKLFRAARAEKVHMHHLQRQTGARVRQVFVPADAVPAEEVRPTVEPAMREEAATPPPKLRRSEQTGPIPDEHHQFTAPKAQQDEAIARSDFMRGFEYERDKYVAFEPAELENLAPKTSSEMQIIEFVSFAEVDPIYLESSYYVAAGNGGEKPYALLLEALRKTGHSAIAEFVMHRRDQIMILRAGGQGIIGHTLFYEDEVKRENEFHADTGLVTPKETDLAIKLVEALAAHFEPEKFKDKYRERLRAAISGKIETGAVTQTKVEAPAAPVIDIMAALKESLTRARKPAASERNARKKRIGAR